MVTNLFILDYESEFGILTLAASEKGIVELNLPMMNRKKFLTKLNKKYNLIYESTELLDTAIKELTEYFCGLRTNFTVPLDIDGSDFQKKVLKRLKNIPYGKNFSLIELSLQLKNVSAVKEISFINKNNPIPIFIPSHRIVGSYGALLCFAGKDLKKLDFNNNLLDFENRNNLVLNKYLVHA